jgi:primosomal protein N'
VQSNEEISNQATKKKKLLFDKLYYIMAKGEWVLFLLNKRGYSTLDSQVSLSPTPILIVPERT